MLLLWQQTPPTNGLLLFRQGSLQQGDAQLQPDNTQLVFQDSPDGWNFVGSVTNSGALAINDSADAWSIAGNVKDSGSLSISDRRDAWSFNGSVTANSATGTLTVVDKPDSWAFKGVLPKQIISVSDGDERKRRKKYRQANEKRRQDILDAYNKLIEHVDPSVRQEAREIAPDISNISDFKAAQLLELAREIDDEEVILLLM